jgi:PAS domain S-box-containing protein
MKIQPNQISVKLKFFLFSVATILFWLFSSFLIFSLINKITSIHETTLDIQKIPIQILEIQKAASDFYNTDLKTETFQETGTADGLRQFNDIYLQTYTGLRQLQSDPFVTEDPLIYQKTELLLDFLNDADNQFQSTVSISRQRGWGNNGTSGSIYSLLEDQENGMGSIESPILRELESELRNYLLNPQSEKILIIEDYINRLSLSVRNESVVVKLLNDIHNLLRLDQELGFSQYEGLLNNVFRSFNILYDESQALNHLSIIQWEKRKKSLALGIIIILILSISLFVLAILYIRRSVLKPLGVLQQHAFELAEGRLPSNLEVQDTGEFGRISGLLNVFVQSLKDKARFSADMSEGKETDKLIALSKDDILANSLIRMEKKIRAARLEDHKNKQSRDERRWTNEGIAKFGEILRIHNNEISALAENIIQELVRFLEAGAGGFFLASGEDESMTLDLISSFAFDRKKYIKKQFAPGEGLIGTCAIEKEKIILTEIPDDYINISSGLGESKPKSLIIIPLKFEEQILGVIEIASITRFMDFEIEFVESLADSIASAVSSVQMNMRTAELLEQSQKQAREMAKQEEIMRQQMEELQTTQEESDRRESEISGILNAIHNSSLVAEYNMNEELININDKFVTLLESQRTQLIGKKHHEIAGVSRYAESHTKFWEEIRLGKTISKVEKIPVPSGLDIWLRQTFTPILDKEGNLFKVLNIANDITENIEQQQSLESQAVEITRANIEMRTFSDAVDSALIKCVYSPAGQILEINDNYENVTGYTKKELVGKNNRIFLKSGEKEQFDKIWEDIQKNKPYKGVIRRTKPTGEEVWIMSNFTPVTDENGNIFKVFYLGQNITERKLKYQLLEEANKEIERMRRQLD